MTDSLLYRQWEQDWFKIDMTVLPFKNKYDKFVIKWHFFDNDILIFEGDSFSPSPQFPPLSDDSVMALISFLTLQPGDTDEEYFKDYTPEQFSWCISERADELRQILMDYENPEEEEVA